MAKMKASISQAPYVRLARDKIEEEVEAQAATKGYFPVLVGKEGMMEKFMVPTKLIKHPFVVQLLEMSAKEYGYGQEGLLKIPYDADCFKNMLHLISKKQ